jgi:lipopolysaccharide/colanic/teichoic acid biosynthesis glycosyltransferase
MLLIALAVKLTSPGPVLYTQLRVGVDRRTGRSPGPFARNRNVDYGGRLFRIYKFRTMVAPRDQQDRQCWATPDDPRITPLGRILRRTRLDELPQLFNVLKGDMNVVGPRPEQPEIFQRLRREIPEYSFRQRVLPGITGWAQVNRHYDRCIADVRRKVALDLEYLHRRSAMEDLRIMLRTVPVMLLGKGAV